MVHITQRYAQIPKWSKMIKAWRLELGETQEEFGKRWGLGKSVVSMYELGNVRPSLDTMRQWLQEGGEKGLEIANQMLYE